MSHSTLFTDCPIVPVVTIADAAHAAPLAEVLLAAGIGAMEITLRTEAAIDAIRSASQVPGILVGAGSIRRVDQLVSAADAGARFCVSPGATPALCDKAAEIDLPFVPGVATASDCLVLMERGYELVKFFPAEVNGGVAAIKALAAPMPELRFFPTGGINALNVKDYLSLEAVTCVGGSWFVPGDALAAGDFLRIEQLAAEAMADVQGVC
ncbi:MAG: bifunctional 4-hydroxy-2-oxoglutarate aldolase/2-dehydro-3-deoxy-phosphogluconate aldolase [Pseudomonadales bacterium]|nr:bifunctional 4-hydroxy-2-oxoglutarate aldolase/2-dehydro-3-deoxy-phosphogluconate aldolase [Pseudomonadales bacterium]